ncbi:MAG: substrate-binding domain-containing protein [Lachnospiraceae bacterium]|nr:substrate-binding domain-containing protein [Lachnospiraceae bacterium]
MRKRIALLLGAVLVFGLWGCGKTQEPVKSETEEKIRIGIIFDTFVVERWQRDRDLFVATAQDLGADVYTQNANGDPSRQEEMIRHFIKDDMDAIVVVAIESDVIADEIQDAREAGIKVVSYDRLAMEANTDLYVSFDNVEVGVLMAEAFTATLEPGDSVVMICGPESDGNTAMVQQGFLETAEAYGLRILDTAYAAEWEAEEAKKYVDEHVDLIREAKGIMCGNDNLAGSVIQALVENQLDTPVVVGQDGDLDACQRIVEGTQYMTVYKPVENLAKRAAEATIELVKEGKVEYDTMISDGEYDVPYIMLKPVAVTRENINETIIDSGFHMKEDVYLNRPEEMPE